MNAHDSEKVIGALEQQGYAQVQIEEDADLLLGLLIKLDAKTVAEIRDFTPAS